MTIGSIPVDGSERFIRRSDGTLADLPRPEAFKPLYQKTPYEVALETLYHGAPLTPTQLRTSGSIFHPRHHLGKIPERA